VSLLRRPVAVVLCQAEQQISSRKIHLLILIASLSLQKDPQKEQEVNIQAGGQHWRVEVRDAAPLETD
jgi:hypothetical protein